VRYIYIYIYIERERERERDLDGFWDLRKRHDRGGLLLVVVTAELVFGRESSAAEKCR
jgi:hypothetical protein